jgi:hypothetical protein
MIKSSSSKKKRRKIQPLLWYARPSSNLYLGCASEETGRSSRNNQKRRSETGGKKTKKKQKKKQKNKQKKAQREREVRAGNHPRTFSFPTAKERTLKQNNRIVHVGIIFSNSYFFLKYFTMSRK